jgi:hypothetical protein
MFNTSQFSEFSLEYHFFCIKRREKEEGKEAGGFYIHYLLFT